MRHGLKRFGECCILPSVFLSVSIWALISGCASKEPFVFPRLGLSSDSIVSLMRRRGYGDGDTIRDARGCFWGLTFYNVLLPGVLKPGVAHFFFDGGRDTMFNWGGGKMHPGHSYKDYFDGGVEDFQSLVASARRAYGTPVDSTRYADGNGTDTIEMMVVKWDNSKVDGAHSTKVRYMSPGHYTPPMLILESEKSIPWSDSESATKK